MCGINDEMFRRFKPPRARRESTSSWKELLNNLLIAGCNGCSPRSAMTTRVAQADVARLKTKLDTLVERARSNGPIK